MCSKTDPKLSVPGWLQSKILELQSKGVKNLQAYITKLKKSGEMPERVISTMYKKGM